VAKSKAELEEDCRKYHLHLAESRAAREAGDHFHALECAAKCLDYVDGMMRYERKYDDRDFRSVPAIDFILTLAPLFLCRQLVSRVEELLYSQRLIEKYTSHDMGGKVSDAEVTLDNAYRLWNYLARNPNTRQDELEGTLGWSQEQWRRLCLYWDEIGLLYREPEGVSYRLRLRKPLHEFTTGKCPACGAKMRKPKLDLFSQVQCETCRELVILVLLAHDSSA
jgi:hypothetical protein